MSNEPYQKMIAIQSIQNRIYEIRGERVMLDMDLAALYEVEARVLNQAVKRNSKRFPVDFMFQLSAAEWQEITSQIVMRSPETNPSSQIVMMKLPKTGPGNTCPMRSPSRELLC